MQHNQVQAASTGSSTDATTPVDSAASLHQAEVDDGARPLHPPPATQWRLPGSDSIWWLVAVAAAFTGAQLIFVRLHGLSWDEVVYVSQVSGHVPAAPFDPARSRGVPLLVAPVALVTSSVTVLRVYLALASGAALFWALFAWRRLRPTWLLALAGVAFGSLWVAQYYGPQAMPDEWLAFAALAATGLFLRAVGVGDDAEKPTGIKATRWRLVGLGALIAAAALIRPGDAVFLVFALLAAALVVRPWRRWPVLAAIVIGMAAGSAEWIAEAYARFGGPFARLHLASAEQGGFGLRTGFWAELRAVNGPTLCRPCTIAWRYPVLSVWWLALPVLVAAGILVARRAGHRASALLAAVCGLALGAQYLFGIWYAAPRFLLPTYALATIPVADLIGWVITRTRPAERPAMRVLIGFVLLLQLVTQHAVLMRQVADTVQLHSDYARVAADLRQLGIGGKNCLINGAQEIPVAFYAGCASAPDPASREPAEPGKFALLEWQASKPPAYAKNWPHHRLAGTTTLKLIAYLPPGQ
ncbi:MAG TPA: hypothetical protein VFI65_08635 [Streptosporangiaceae bacterium]|nr:hypothetical protein [Streptosporangiaceae bacterium]